MNTNQINKSWNFNNTTAKVEGSFVELTLSYEDKFTGEISHTFISRGGLYIRLDYLCYTAKPEPSAKEMIEFIKETILAQENKQ